MSKDRPRSSRAVVAIALVALVATSVAITWYAAGQIRSPAEAAARTLAPAHSPILVPVEDRIISTDIVTRGTGRFGSPQTLSIAPTMLKPSTALVDSVPELGAEVHDGDVALVVSGRPVFVLEGDQPAYRDLGPGISGADVLQLEVALERLGHPPGAVDGLYDEDTETAVAEWYETAGYEALAATADQLGEIRTLEADLIAAEREVLGAADALAAARAEATAVRAAVVDEIAAGAAAQQALGSAVADAEAANHVARSEVATARGAAAAAFQKLPPPNDESEEGQAAIRKWKNLMLAAEAAEASASAIEQSGAAGVRAAQVEVDVAPDRIATAQAAVAAAEDRVAIAVEQIELAESSTPQLRQDLARAMQRAGTQVPVDEIIFVPDAPVRVAEVLVARGDEATGALLAVTDAVVAIDGALALDQVTLVSKGMSVAISEPDLGIEATGVVNQVADGPGTRGADGFHVWFEVLVSDSEVPISTIAGASVRLTLPIETSGGPVLAVPASAVSLAVDGSSQVLVETEDGLRPVVVEPGLAASGYVAVTATEATLSSGDMVVIGFETRAVSSG